MLDWGVPGDEERHTTWDDLIARLHRAVRRIARRTGSDSIGMLGYCMGGTLSAIYAALHPECVRSLVNLAGPIDFSEGGELAHMVRPEWFDADAIAEAGNIGPEQMQSGFVALKPMQQLSKWVTLADRWTDYGFRESFATLENWANDNIAFPAAAYRTYIRDLYQDNALVRGTHRINGECVDLGNIRSPLLVVSASRDHICPPAAAEALCDLSGADPAEHYQAPGGHIGAVVGHHARAHLYPHLSRWLRAHLGNDQSPTLSRTS